MKKKSKKKIGVFYLSVPRPTESPNWSRKGDPVRHGDGSHRAHDVLPNFVFVRCEIARGAKNLTDALDRAKPRRGESVMNSHYVD